MNVKTMFFLSLFALCLVGRSLAFTIKAESAHEHIEQGFPSYFLAIEATDDGIYLTRKESGLRIRIWVDGKDLGVFKPPGKYLIRYDQRLFLRLYKDAGIRFFPLENEREGFLVRTTVEGRSVGLPLRKTYAILQRKDEIYSDGKTYEIVEAYFDENGTPLPYELKISTRLDGNGPPFYTTNVVSEAGIPEEETQSLSQKKPISETAVVVSHTNNTLTERPQQTVEEEPPNSWKFIFPIIGILLVAIFAFFKLRKR